MFLRKCIETLNLSSGIPDSNAFSPEDAGERPRIARKRARKIELWSGLFPKGKAREPHAMLSLHRQCTRGYLQKDYSVFPAIPSAKCIEKQKLRNFLPNRRLASKARAFDRERS